MKHVSSRLNPDPAILVAAAVVEFKADKANAVFIELTTTKKVPRQYR
jgi:hypothetical protein